MFKTRTKKVWTYDVVRTEPLIEQIEEFLDTLGELNEIDTYKKLMKEFGFPEEFAKGIVKGYINGDYLNITFI